MVATTAAALRMQPCGSALLNKYTEKSLFNATHVCYDG